MHSRLVFGVLVVNPSCADCSSLSDHSSTDKLFSTYAAAPPPCSQSTCCQICRCRSRYRAWCHLCPVSVSTPCFPAFTKSYQCSKSQSRGLVKASHIAGRGPGGHTCIWWPKSWEVLVLVDCANGHADVANLQANAAQVAQSTEDSRHGCGWCCVGAMGCGTRSSRLKHWKRKREVSIRGKRGSCSPSTAFLARLLEEDEGDDSRLKKRGIQLF
jgi:hypothetical protein